MKRTRNMCRALGDEKEDKTRRHSSRRKRRVRSTEEAHEKVRCEEYEDTHKRTSRGTGLLPVTCGDKKGVLHVQKLSRGEECIQCEGCWLTPAGFEVFSGRGTSKKWKTTILHKHKPLQILFERGILITTRFKRRGTKSTTPQKRLASNQGSENTSEDSEVQSTEEAEDGDVKDDNLGPGSEEVALDGEEGEKGEEERIRAENGEGLVDSGGDKSTEAGDEMENGGMEDEDAVTGNSDNSVSQERETRWSIPTSGNDLLQPFIVIERLKVAMDDCDSKQPPKEGPPTTPQNVPVECKHGSPGSTSATAYSHDMAQSPVMKPEEKDPQTSPARGSFFSSDENEDLSPCPSISINVDTMDLHQLKREKIKMQLRVLRLQEEYYTLSIKELKGEIISHKTKSQVDKEIPREMQFDC